MNNQLCLFEECREDRLEREIALLRQQCDKVRKGQFAKISELTKMYLEIKNEHELLKSAICRST